MSRKIAKRLSTDKPYEDLVKGFCPPQDNYIIYANGATWVLKCFIRWELYWISEHVDIKNISLNDAEYICTWLPVNKQVRNIRRIIWTHPNLTDPFISLIIPSRLIEFLWRIGFRFTQAR